MISGLLLLDKPCGMTSHQLVHRVRKILNQKQVGHCGTLDPVAQGLMVLLLGQACRLSQYLLSKDKVYELTMKLGQTTDTLDKEGQILVTKNVDLKQTDIQETLKKSLGCLELEVPAFSAVKYKGKKLYEYARRDESGPVIKKEMFFYNLSIQSIYKDEVQVRLSCHKGGYIRSWVHLIGEKLGVGAHLLHLKRLASIPYFLDQSISLSQFELRSKQSPSEWMNQVSFFIPMKQALPHIPSVDLNHREERLFCHGQVPYSCQERWPQGEFRVIRVMSASNKRLLGLVQMSDLRKPCILGVFSS